MSDYGNPQADQILPNDQQRNAITAALMGIARPPGKGQLPQMPGRLPTNVSGGMSAIGNAIGGMAPTPPVAPGPPMSLAPPQGPQQPPPMSPPQPGAPPPQGTPVGAGAPPAMPQDPMLQGTGSLY